MNSGWAIMVLEAKKMKLFMTGVIGIVPKQYEFECPCGYIWIDSQREPCPMCTNEIDISAKLYETKHPDTFGKRQS